MNERLIERGRQMARRGRALDARMIEPEKGQLRERIQFLEGVVIETQIARERAERKLEAIQSLVAAEDPPLKHTPLEYRNALKRAINAAG
jgi:hypothetical protein